MVYWEMARKGEAWESAAVTLSKIYYACEAVVDNQDVVNECPHGSIPGYADLSECDTTERYE